MFFINKKIKVYFEKRHSFGYFCGWDEVSEKYVDFNLLNNKQKLRIVKKNSHIFRNPYRYTYKDFKDVQLIYFGKNLLE